MNEPNKKRTIVFIDGQNLFHSVKEAFGYSYPNYDVQLLAEKVCLIQGWDLTAIRFYTGVPDGQDNDYWHQFWVRKLTYMGQKGVVVFSRPLRYRNKTVEMIDGKEYSFPVGQEKGIDVRIALDIIKLARQETYDAALVFSQDQDLSEVADEIREIAVRQNRWIKMASAFPVSPTAVNKRGINKTDWVKIDKRTYDACIDAKDYR